MLYDEQDELDEHELIVEGEVEHDEVFVIDAEVLDEIDDLGRIDGTDDEESDEMLIVDDDELDDNETLLLIDDLVEVEVMLFLVIEELDDVADEVVTVMLEIDEMQYGERLVIDEHLIPDEEETEVVFTIELQVKDEMVV